MADLNTFEWEDVEVLVPKIDGYTFLGYDDCTKNLPCYWFDFTDRKLVEACESEYPFYAMLYVENTDKCVQGDVETTATNIRVLERVAHDNRDGLSEVIRRYRNANNLYSDRLISERGTLLTRDEFTSVLNTIHTYAQDNYYHRSPPRVSDSIAVVNEIERTIFGKTVRMESPDSDGN